MGGFENIENDADFRKYKDFRRSLKLNSKYWEYETKEQLRLLMTNAGYGQKSEKGVLYLRKVTDKQVDYAWKYLKKGGQARL